MNTTVEIRGQFVGVLGIEPKSSRLVARGCTLEAISLIHEVCLNQHNADLQDTYAREACTTLRQALYHLAILSESKFLFFFFLEMYLAFDLVISREIIKRKVNAT